MSADDAGTPNPAGKNGKPIKIALPFATAVRAALETSPPPKQEKRRPRRKKQRS